MILWKKIILALFALACLFVGPSCKKSENLSYYPLNEGLIWTYQISNGEGVDDKGALKTLMVENLKQRHLKMEKVTPQKVTFKEKSDLKFIIENEEGVFEFGKQPNGMVMPEINDPKIFYLKTPFQTGVSWEESYATQFLPEKMMVPLTVQIESINETVSVKAGTYLKCLKLTKKGQFNKDHGEFFGTANVTVDKMEWYAPGVGLIKSELSETSNQVMFGKRTAVQELQTVKR